MATTFAGPAVWEQPFIDRKGNFKPGEPVTVYLRGTATLATLYTDHTKTTSRPNPTATNAEGNLWIVADPGRYQAVVDGKTLYCTVVADPAEPVDLELADGAVTTAKLADGAATGAKLGPDVATDVELAAVAAAAAAGLGAHTGDPADAHDASSVSFVPVGTVAATDVQAAIAEVAADAEAGGAGLGAHLADGVDAHDASSVSVTPAGGLLSTDVQAALAELQAGKEPSIPPGTYVPKALVDAKGDIIAATAADTVARLPVGADGYVLTASAAAATGLAWAEAASDDTGEINVEDHGVDPVATAAANAAAVQVAYNLLTAGGSLYFPRIYPVAADVITLGKKNVTFRGSGMYSGGIQPAVGGSLFAGAAGVEVFGNITFEDMFFGGNSTGTPYILNANGSQLTALTVRRCQFFENNGITVQGVSDVTVEDCLFHTAGNPLIGQALGTSGESRRVIFRRNRLLYMQSGVSGNSGSDPGGNQQVAEHMDISDNYFDGGWPISKTMMANSGGTVTYAAAVLTDTAPTTPFTTLIPGGQEQTYSTRILTPRRTGSGGGVTYGYGSNNLTDTGASFIAQGVKRGEIVRTATLFGVVVNVESATVLNVEQWLSRTDYTPQPQPAAGTEYTVYQVQLGLITARTATTVTINNGFGNFHDLNGLRATPANGALYEIIAHGNYNMHVEYSHRKIKCVGNTCLRSWNDQISLYGYDGLIMGNYVEDGQDFGITIHGTGWVVVANRIHHQGTVGITVPSDSIVQGNHIWDTTWTTDGDSYNAAIHIEGSRNLIQGNVIDGGGSVARPYARYGIVTEPFGAICDSNRIEGNIFKGHLVSDLRIANAAAGTVTNVNIGTNEHLSVLPAVAITAAGAVDLNTSCNFNKVRGPRSASTGKPWSVYDGDTQVLNYNGGQFNCYGYSGFFGPVYVASPITFTGQFKHEGTTIGLNGAAATAQSAGWGSPTGTATKTAFDTAAVTLPELAERVKAIIDYLKLRGDFGA